MSVEKPSRTQMKLQARRLQETAVQLLELPRSDLERLDIPDKLKSALLDCREMTRHGAVRRQKQHIGAIMRTIDPAPVEAAVKQLNMERERAARRFQKMEAWREQLIKSHHQGDSSVLDLFLKTHPDTDRRRLIQLIRNAVNAAGSPREKQARKKVFQYISEVTDLSASTETDPPGTEPAPPQQDTGH